MIRHDLVMAKIDMIQVSLRRLAKLAAVEESRFITDHDYFAIAEHHLRRALEALFVQQITGMAGYRNRLVHGYAEVTPRVMYSPLKERLGDIETFCRHILEYLDREQEPRT